MLSWSLRNRSKCKDLDELFAFGTGSRLEINIFMYSPLFKLNIDNINNININNINNIELDSQKPSQMQRSHRGAGLKLVLGQGPALNAEIEIAL